MNRMNETDRALVRVSALADQWWMHIANQLDMLRQLVAAPDPASPLTGQLAALALEAILRARHSGPTTVDTMTPADAAWFALTPFADSIMLAIQRRFADSTDLPLLAAIASAAFIQVTTRDSDHG